MPDSTPANVKRSLKLAGAATSVAVEPEFWRHLERLAADRGQPLSYLVQAVRLTSRGSLSRALRLAVLADLERRCGLQPQALPRAA